MDSITTFKRRQRVLVGCQAEPATIVRPDRHSDGWFIVRFDDGGMLCVSVGNLQAA
jgi:hypothetical protein